MLTCVYVRQGSARSACLIGREQEPILALMSRHLDAKGKQAKLKSPQELQDLLDVTRELLQSMERQHAKTPAPPTPHKALERAPSGEKQQLSGGKAAEPAKKEGARKLDRSMTHAGQYMLMLYATSSMLHAAMPAIFGWTWQVSIRDQTFQDASSRSFCIMKEPPFSGLSGCMVIVQREYD